jgi:proline-rich protein PRCC
MMLDIEGYGSGSDNESNTEASAVLQPAQQSAKLSQATKKPIFSLPSPSATTSKISLPPPKPKRAPKKIAIGLPSLRANGDDVDDLVDERPVAKKARLDSGAGASSLLSMLPAPKQKNPTLPPPERVLGGGKGPSLVFNTPRPVAPVVPDEFISSDEPDDIVPIPQEAAKATIPFLPPSLGKGRSNISVEEGKPITQVRTQKPAAPAVDFFSLGTSLCRILCIAINHARLGNSLASSSKTTTTTPSSAAPALPSLSSAPVIPTFEPPRPLQTDSYPGYYQLPSGAWAAHDPAYFAKYVKKWEAEYNAHVRALEKGMVKGFEGLETAVVEEIDAMKEMEKAKVEIREREERKAVTQGADGGPVAPKININVSPPIFHSGFGANIAI